MASKNLNEIHPGSEESSDGLIRRLGIRYLMVLVLVALLITLDQAVVQPLLSRVDTYAPAINLAGRQRMLSQKLAKAALALQATNEPGENKARRKELQETLEQWSRSHTALQHGDQELGIRSIDSPEIAQQWRLLQPHFDAMCDETLRLVAEPVSERGSPVSVRAVDEILAHEAQFLGSMDRIVDLMERGSAREVTRLRAYALAIAAAVILLLVGVGWFVVRPATRTIRDQVDGLEARVARRTQELASALASLRRESGNREAAESKNKTLAAQLAHADRIASMGHLSVGLAHEINQPLGAIANHAEACEVLLSQLPESEERERTLGGLDRIKQASLRAGKIVRGLRNFLRPGTDARIEANINVLVKDVVDLCRHEIDEADVELTMDLSTDQGIVCVDLIQIQQVLVNLVQNALQAMQDCSNGVRRLDIRTLCDSDIVQVDLTDSGPGFAGADAEAMFELFRTTKRNGLGFGLAICRSIVERHEGVIWVESAPGNGAHVSFTLPLASRNESVRTIESNCVCSR